MESARRRLPVVVEKPEKKIAIEEFNYFVILNFSTETNAR